MTKSYQSAKRQTQVAVYIDKEKHRQIQIISLADDKQISLIVDEAIDTYLAKHFRRAQSVISNVKPAKRATSKSTATA